MRARRAAIRGELGGELAALLDAGRKLRGDVQAPPLRREELPRIPEPRVPSYRLRGEAADKAREADYRRELRRKAATERARLQKQRGASAYAEDVAAVEVELFEDERREVRSAGRELVERARAKLAEAEAAYKAQVRRDQGLADRKRDARLPRSVTAGEWLSLELGNIPAELHPLARKELPRIRAALRADGNERVAPWERFLEDFEAGTYEHHAHAPRVTDRELAREAERYHAERLLERDDARGVEAIDLLDDDEAERLARELDELDELAALADEDPPF